MQVQDGREIEAQGLGREPDSLSPDSPLSRGSTSSSRRMQPPAQRLRSGIAASKDSTVPSVSKPPLSPAHERYNTPSRVDINIMVNCKYTVFYAKHMFLGLRAFRLNWLIVTLNIVPILQDIP